MGVEIDVAKIGVNKGSTFLLNYHQGK